MSEKVGITIVGEGFARPSDVPVLGSQRIVRYLPCGMPGTKGSMFPCIWESPYEVFDADLKENVKICILLLQKGPPKPEIIAVRIPAAAIQKFPLSPVEW